MTDPVVTLSPDTVSVPTGGQARVVVSITNPSQIVEGYTVDVVDDQPPGAGPSGWAQVMLADDAVATDRSTTVSVYPQQTCDVVVVFTPGSGPQVPGGTFVFGVRVISTVNPEASAVAEGEVEVGRVHGLSAKLSPVTSTGRWQGRHVLEISNWGNAPARLKITASDPDQALGYLIRPDIVEVPLGGTATARVQVRTRSPRLRGATTRLPFTVAGEPDPPLVERQPGPPGAPDPSRPVADGAFTQKPILTKTVVAVMSLLLVGGIAGGAYAFTRRSEPAAQGVDGTVPATPVLSPIAVAGPDSVTVSWEAIDRATGYELLHVAPGSDAVAAVDTLGADIRAQQVSDLQQGTQYCFQMRAIRDELRSPLSEPACATTTITEQTQTATLTPPAQSEGSGEQTAASGGENGAETGSAGGGGTQATTPSAGQAFQPGQTAALVYVRPANAPLALEGLQQLQATLAARDVQTSLLNTDDYPAIAPRLEPSWAVYLGPFADAATATSQCAAVRDTTPPIEDCLVVVPVPAQAATPGG
ncbi:MAG: hypothetical protein ACK5MT_06825 [Actinomycetales bacterium]